MHLVTGGNGLVGRSIVRLLLERGERVRVFDLKPSLEPQAESLVGDLRNIEDITKAVAGVTTVFHCAALVDVSLGKPRHLYDVNVAATQNLLLASRQAGVKKFIYTSSIDVVFDGSPIMAGDETLPYASRFLDFYSETKALAEQAILRANSPDLLTCAVRPAGIFGPGDIHRFPDIIRNALSSKYTQIGDGKALFNHVYVDNVAYMHVLAADKLAPGHASAGSAYFATDYAPINFFAFFRPYLAALNLEVKTSVISERTALTIAQMSEVLWRVLPNKWTSSPLLTRYIILSTCRDLWFTSRKAQADLGYTPLVSQQNAFQRTLDWVRETWLPKNT